MNVVIILKILLLFIKILNEKQRSNDSNKDIDVDGMDYDDDIHGQHNAIRFVFGIYITIALCVLYDVNWL